MRLFCDGSLWRYYSIMTRSLLIGNNRTGAKRCEQRARRLRREQGVWTPRGETPQGETVALRWMMMMVRTVPMSALCQ